jgi:APA family basic amino acid/polyamine antiporter
VQAIILAAEEPSKIRGGARLGGLGSTENYVGEATKTVIAKAPCTVILTAPPMDDSAVSAGAAAPDASAAVQPEQRER